MEDGERGFTNTGIDQIWPRGAREVGQRKQVGERQQEVGRCQDGLDI